MASGNLPLQFAFIWFEERRVFLHVPPALRQPCCDLVRSVLEKNRHAVMQKRKESRSRRGDDGACVERRVYGCQSVAHAHRFFIQTTFLQVGCVIKAGKKHEFAILSLGIVRDLFAVRELLPFIKPVRHHDTTTFVFRAFKHGSTRDKRVVAGINGLD